jgi:hypothetical protein
MKKKLTLRRETLQLLDNALTLPAAGFSGIGTCVYCDVTKVQGGCTGHGTTNCTQ